MYWRSSNFMQKIKRAWEENSEKSVLRIDWQTDGHELTGLCRNAGSTISFIQNESVIIFHKLKSAAILNYVLVLSGH